MKVKNNLFSFEENAEGLCEHAANLALEYNPQGIDSLQTLANLRLSQLRASDSAKILETLSLKIFDIFEKYQSKNIKDLILDENDGINLPLVSDGNYNEYFHVFSFFIFYFQISLLLKPVYQ